MLATSLDTVTYAVGRIAALPPSAASVLRAVLSKNSDGIISRADFTLAELACALRPFDAVNG